MRISNKIHRGASMVAAIVMLILLLISTVFSMISLLSLRLYAPEAFISNLVNLLLGLVCTIFLIIPLFLGKKDVLAAIFVLVPVLHTAVTLIRNLISFFSLFRATLSSQTACIAASQMIYFVSNVALAAFYLLIVMECFKPGKISGSRAKSFLVVLPIVQILLVFFGNIVQSLYQISDFNFMGSLVSVVLSAFIAAIFSAPRVIMGIAYSIPVKEPIIYEGTYGNI